MKTFKMNSCLRIDNQKNYPNNIQSMSINEIEPVLFMLASIAEKIDIDRVSFANQIHVRIQISKDIIYHINYKEVK